MTALTRLAKMVFSRYQILMDRASDLLARFSRIVAADGYDRGLQPVQWQALMFLRSANRFSRTPKALTAWLGQTKGSVSQTIAALEKKGLITRRTDPDDQRVVRLDLTEAGTSLVAGPPPALATQMLGHLTAAQRDSFAELVEQMLRAELARSGGRPFGACRDCRHFESGLRSALPHHCRLLDVALSRADGALVCIEQEAA